MMPGSVEGSDRAEVAEQPEQAVIVPLRHRPLAADPRQKIVIALPKQRFIPVELRGIQGRQMAVGKTPEEQIALETPSIPALVEEPLAADGDRFGHGRGKGCDLGGRQMAKDVASAGRFSNTGVAEARRRPRTPEPADPLGPLLAPVRTLKGVGPSFGAALTRLVGAADGGEARCLDLLWHLPHGVVERRLQPEAAALVEGERVTLKVEVRQHQPARSARRRHRARAGPPHKVRCWTGTTFVDLVFFQGREAYLRSVLPEGEQRVVSGRLARFGAEWQIVHPELVATPDRFARAGPLQSLYPLTSGLSQHRLGRCITEALARLQPLPEWQDPAWLERHAWPSFEGALHRLHRPQTEDDAGAHAQARRRLAYDELLAGQLALALVRGREDRDLGRRLTGDGRLRRAVLAALPFRPTGAQRQALSEIDADLARPERMLRLLQGDVGSGKTLVAVLAMLAAVESGAQAALMAPSEVLARQHHATLTTLLAPAGLQPTLLTGRERGAARARALAGLARGTSPIAIGTHALFQDEVSFADLALAVIDEQHRFGVHQRLELAAKGRRTDLLVMTATPIPRTLVLALYGDMAVSELREKPPGRLPVRTRALSLARLDQIVAAVRRALDQDERLYWVCPTISADEDASRAAAEERHAMLRERFGGIVGLVHGRLSALEQDRAMRDFGRGALRLLVATTVIEVGVDVPEASVIVIERAERFGLAQLHQLRGRVGRSGRASSCLLLYQEPLGATGRARLEALRATDDGFRIAEEDLRLRGPGEVLGTRQSGLPALRLADLAVHADLLAPAREDARRTLTLDPGLHGPRGRALRHLLRLFEREGATAYLSSG
jgi:ATP-dependent DNA helicase RecG